MFLALIPFVAWPLWEKFNIKPASATMRERTKAAVEKHPELKGDWNKAMEDDVLTFPEAKAILEKAGEKVEPEQ
jgi:hypothetical protein